MWCGEVGVMCLVWCCGLVCLVLRGWLGVVILVYCDMWCCIVGVVWLVQCGVVRRGVEPPTRNHPLPNKAPLPLNNPPNHPTTPTHQTPLSKHPFLNHPPVKRPDRSFCCLQTPPLAQSCTAVADPSAVSWWSQTLPLGRPSFHSSRCSP